MTHQNLIAVPHYSYLLRLLLRILREASLPPDLRVEIIQTIKVAYPELLVEV